MEVYTLAAISFPLQNFPLQTSEECCVWQKRNWKIVHDIYLPAVKPVENFSSLQNRKSYQCVKNIEGRRHQSVAPVYLIIALVKTPSNQTVHTHQKASLPAHLRECTIEEAIKMENDSRLLELQNKTIPTWERRTKVKGRKNSINIRPYKTALLRLKQAHIPRLLQHAVYGRKMLIKKWATYTRKIESLFRVSWSRDVHFGVCYG